jgi:hypothetical protein
LQKSKKDSKVHKFMFAFTGSIDFDKMKNKVDSAEVGNFDEGVKYCFMKLKQPNGRRESVLSNIIREYNLLADDCGIVLVSPGAGLPLIMVWNGYSGNVIECMLLSDRVLKPPGYEIWPRPVNTAAEVADQIVAEVIAGVTGST